MAKRQTINAMIPGTMVTYLIPLRQTAIPVIEAPNAATNGITRHRCLEHSRCNRIDLITDCIKKEPILRGPSCGSGANAFAKLVAIGIITLPTRAVLDGVAGAKIKSDKAKA